MQELPGTHGSKCESFWNPNQITGYRTKESVMEPKRWWYIEGVLEVELVFRRGWGYCWTMNGLRSWIGEARLKRCDPRLNAKGVWREISGESLL